MNIAHIISRDLQFDLIEMYLLTKQNTEMYLCFDQSNNCGDFSRHEVVKFILPILKRNFSTAKLQANKNAHAQINFAAKLSFISPNVNP